MDFEEKVRLLHRRHGGKIEVNTKVPVESREDLSLAYTPGVAIPCLDIMRRPDAIYDYTSKSNLVAVVTNGTAVLGLGDIGADASLPVMEGKCILFKRFAGIDAFPICVDTKDPDLFIDTVCRIQSSFGGINLEDIKAPECFYIERELKRRCNIPVFHDDQHGTAIVVAAAAINAFRLLKKEPSEARVAVSGAGAAAQSVVRLLFAAGFREISMCDIEGVVYEGRPGLNPALAEIAALTNRGGIHGGLADIMEGADLFVGLSAPGIVSSDMIRRMNRDPVVFAMANPTPEIMPEEAKAGGARIIGTGRSDYPNQINNVLAFPGIFRGALDARAPAITEEMKLAAAKGIAALVDDGELREEYIIPDVFDSRVCATVARYVSEIAAKNATCE
ncbi:NADP-dependent malic enzyme [Anaerotruncus massiliensis (ex Togo et al. 2019)]|uniref:NAD(P)-dependent malic enzyme n=1 Tax=Anaerotruncus TaxID=244127 RepID=UPI000C787A2A|nr:malic enzyme-like NAD(P)-binding protein [Anaerotruncus massiliensis (ex Togo et al. 2019)]